MTKLATLLAAGGRIVFRVAWDTRAARIATGRDSDVTRFAFLGGADATQCGFGNVVACDHDAENGWRHIGGHLKKLAPSDLIVIK